MTPYTIQILEMISYLKKEGIWASVLHGNYSYICKLGRLLNHPNWTCIAQVMVHFPGLLQLRLFNGLCPVFETVRGLISELSSELFCGLLWLDCEGVLHNMECTYVDVDICMHDILT